MESNRRPKGLLRYYMLWPFLLAVPIIILAVWLYAHGYTRGGTICLITAGLALVIAGILYAQARSVFYGDLAHFFVQYETQQLSIMRRIDAPLALALKNGKIVWANDAFKAATETADRTSLHLSDLAPDLNPGRFPKDPDDCLSVDYAFNGREGEMKLRMTPITDFANTRRLLKIDDDLKSVISVTLTDLSDLHQALREKQDVQLAAGLIYIDNYDELMDSIEEVRQSLVLALIEQEINQYVVRHNGLIKKMENDKYFFAVRRRDLTAMQKDKFEVLEIVKKIDTGISASATLAIGVGLDASSFTQSSDNARSAISMALARGGDQAAVKDGDTIEYFGGKGEQGSKNTRVKARVKAHDLCELIMVKDSVYIMGHKIADADSLGAAIGIYKIAVSLERPAHIVIDTVTDNLRPLFETFSKDPDYPQDMFIKPDQAFEQAHPDSLLVVVDTNIPNRVECEKLLSKCRTIVVFDHHRQSSSHIEMPTLSYIEPYASSACEMVTEVVQYTDIKVKLSKKEANALYAGIVIDTHNFVNRTGVRTFEAASVLRRAGADITQVRKLFRDDLSSYKEKAIIISHAQVYRKRFAIACYDGENASSPTILGAEAANELLDIEGIQASFVLTSYKGNIYVSARSIDDVNVQVLMEKLGGGGHINIAGAQFDHTDMDRALASLKGIIDAQIEAGNL